MLAGRLKSGPSARLKLPQPAVAREKDQVASSPAFTWRARRELQCAALLIAASVVGSLGFVVADALARTGWSSLDVRSHWLASGALYLAAAGLAGVLLWLLTGLGRALSALVASRWPRLSIPVSVLFYGGIAAAAAAPTARWLFSGEKVQRTSAASFGPPVVLATLFVGAGLAAWLVLRSVHAARAGRRTPARLLGAALVAFAALVLAADLTLFVALYSRMHTLLEIVGALSLVGGIALLLHTVADRRVLDWAVVALAAFGVTWSGFVVSRDWSRAWIDDRLKHVWLEPVYVGRMLQRLQLAQAYLADPQGFRGLAQSQMDRLTKRYDISTLARSPVWDEPWSEPPALTRQLEALRGEFKNYNVLIYYVDTLRQDVAADPKTMPGVQRFAKTALDFRSAYSTGSDTIRGLPGLTGGSYDLSGERHNDLLAVARASHMESVLVIAQSAREFLAKLRPSFAFDQTLVVADYAPEKEVWGYGADGPTAGQLVDRSLEWLEGHPDQRFFMWLFNFDVHAWRELDERYVNDMASKYDVREDAPLSWRYRVVARALDAEFERLIHGLKKLGKDRDTIVLFVSDHGEGLGRDGFWVHSVFLWESLVRVPLMLRIPGIAPRHFDQRVSVVDVAPTLARYMSPSPDLNGYHGEDLLGYLVSEPNKRRFPLLMAGAEQQVLVRLGIVDPEDPWKLVLSLESSVPELYHLNGDDPDASNVGDHHPTQTLKLLSTLVRSPVFPRAAEDFTMIRPAAAAAAK